MDGGVVMLDPISEKEFFELSAIPMWMKSLFVALAVAVATVVVLEILEALS